jgi:hypothetical protein
MDEVPERTEAKLGLARVGKEREVVPQEVSGKGVGEHALEMGSHLHPHSARSVDVPWRANRNAAAAATVRPSPMIGAPYLAGGRSRVATGRSQWRPAIARSESRR